jgi:hypothetical protein
MPTDAKSGGDYDHIRARITPNGSGGAVLQITVPDGARWCQIRIPDTSVGGTDQSAYTGVIYCTSSGDWGTVPTDAILLAPGDAPDAFPVAGKSYVYMRAAHATETPEVIVTFAGDGRAATSIDSEDVTS